MHCKTDAINQVSLQCFIKSEGWSQGKSTAFVQILQIFTVGLSSCWCRVYQFPFGCDDFWARCGVITLSSIAVPWGHLPGMPALAEPCLAPAVVCSRSSPVLLQGSCRFSPRGPGAALARSHACAASAAGEGFVCAACTEADRLLALVKYFARAFCWRFLDSSEHKWDFSFSEAGRSNQFVWCFRTPEGGRLLGCFRVYQMQPTGWPLVPAKYLVCQALLLLFIWKALNVIFFYLS